ncbi:conserved hypothetical protein [Coccidioides posadasii str. Silveira]|uniref:Uncharacterized protein n=1 Tax=Coccidioides posadasii (strain RMSCC 757 / Silveira) TaxID=443226 RepID=E9DET1_COCPS|nr:conserved hypothetical protein [Coccidioides posadasii str. Silveira]
MVKWQEKLNALQNTQKHSQSESLDMVTSNPTPTKHLLILRPPQHTKYYQTGIYTEYHQFISDIESIHNASKLNDEDTLVYALTGLGYIEKDFGRPTASNPSKNNWTGLKEFLHARLGDPANCM